MGWIIIINVKVNATLGINIIFIVFLYIFKITFNVPII